MKITREQVKLANEEGASIHIFFEGKWRECHNPSWEWDKYKYRIGTTSYNGVSLHTIAKKWQAVLYLGKTYSAAEFITWAISDIFSFSDSEITRVFLNRQWTKEEFKKHRDEWFVCKLTGVIYKVGFYLDSGVYLIGRHEQTTFEDLYNHFTRENGSPCGE